MDGMIENKALNENENRGNGIGICRECRWFVGFDGESGRRNVCARHGMMRGIVCKVVRCDGYETSYENENRLNENENENENSRQCTDSGVGSREGDLNAMRRERDRLDKMIKNAERREQDLIVARNARIVWERRLKDSEVGSGVEIGGVEVRTAAEVEAVVEMFRRIEGMRVESLEFRV